MVFLAGREPSPPMRTRNVLLVVFQLAEKNVSRLSFRVAVRLKKCGDMVRNKKRPRPMPVTFHARDYLALSHASHPGTNEKGLASSEVVKKCGFAFPKHVKHVMFHSDLVLLFMILS